ncbi:unnamed protein product, partial [Ectocarpus sp. 12 AP-2014]
MSSTTGTRVDAVRIVRRRRYGMEVKVRLQCVETNIATLPCAPIEFTTTFTNRRQNVFCFRACRTRLWIDTPRQETAVSLERRWPSDVFCTFYFYFFDVRHGPHVSRNKPRPGSVRTCPLPHFLTSFTPDSIALIVKNHKHIHPRHTRR